jgi:hypothetical protein
MRDSSENFLRPKPKFHKMRSWTRSVAGNDSSVAIGGGTGAGSLATLTTCSGSGTWLVGGGAKAGTLSADWGRFFETVSAVFYR